MFKLKTNKYCFQVKILYFCFFDFLLNTDMKSIIVFISIFITSISVNAFSGIEIENAYNAVLKKDYKQAIELYSIVIKDSPKYPQAYYGRALSYYYQNQYNLALVDFNKAIEINPNYKEALLGRGLCYLSINEFVKSENDLKQLIILDPKLFEAYYSLGNLFFTQELFEESIVHYSKCIEINPSYSNAYYGRGASFRNIENNDQALRDFVKYLDLAGKNAIHSDEAQRLINLINENK